MKWRHFIRKPAKRTGTTGASYVHGGSPPEPGVGSLSRKRYTQDVELRMFKKGKQQEITGFGTTGSHHCLEDITTATPAHARVHSRSGGGWRWNTSNIIHISVY
jgi:hypothetical protein